MNGPGFALPVMLAATVAAATLGCDGGRARTEVQPQAQTAPGEALGKLGPTPRVEEVAGPEQLSGSPVQSMTSTTSLELPEVTLTNQHGEPVSLGALLADKFVVIQTMFTTCGTICPPMGANFSRLQDLLESAPDVALISISIDPITDTPERLTAWATKFDAGPRWTLLTGSSAEITKVLKALRVFTAEKEEHSSMVVIGHASAGIWTRADGLSDPATIVGVIDELRGRLAQAGAQAEPGGVLPEAATAEAGEPGLGGSIAHNYFTDVELVDQHGKTHRLYSDLLQGKVVVINSFFTSCEGVCPPMTQRIASLQEPLADHLGEDLLFLSLTVDPITDTPDKLAAYAKKFDAREGWLFLGGDKKKVDEALGKFGFGVEAREAHSNLMIVGNEATGLWKKAFSLAEAKDLLVVINSVLDDQGA